MGMEHVILTAAVILRGADGGAALAVAQSCVQVRKQGKKSLENRRKSQKNEKEEKKIKKEKKQNVNLNHFRL